MYRSAAISNSCALRIASAGVNFAASFTSGAAIAAKISGFTLSANSISGTSGSRKFSADKSTSTDTGKSAVASASQHQQHTAIPVTGLFHGLLQTPDEHAGRQKIQRRAVSVRRCGAELVRSQYSFASRNSCSTSARSSAMPDCGVISFVWFMVASVQLVQRSSIASASAFFRFPVLRRSYF